MTMRIHLPFRNIEEIDPLVEAGADSFYCGVIHPISSINDRSNSEYFNLPDMKALADSVKKIHDHGKTIAVTVNKQTLDIKNAVDFVREVDAMGVDSVILSSLTLLHVMKDVELRCGKSLSCTNPVLNTDTLDFFRQFNLEKVCLPRHLSLDEIEGLNANKGDWELEIFIMAGLCVFTEGYCGMHALPYGDQGEPCYCFKVEKTNGKAEGGRKDKAGYIEGHLHARNLDGCGLCAIPRFLNMGMDFLKVEGRDEPLHDRIAYAKGVRDMIRVLREGKLTGTAYTDVAKRYCDDNVAVCKPSACYY